MGQQKSADIFTLQVGTETTSHLVFSLPVSSLEDVKKYLFIALGVYHLVKGVSAKMSLRVRMLKKLQSPKLALRSFGNIFPSLSDKFLEMENYSHSN